mmetsp:Transcript_56349/g.171602  ORF Transcript_56349/g.171602 Transcript_56349/m.171602 type:complete len:345 (-) Transcript_56349:36-1070(-)
MSVFLEVLGTCPLREVRDARGGRDAPRVLDVLPSIGWVTTLATVAVVHATGGETAGQGGVTLVEPGVRDAQGGVQSLQRREGPATAAVALVVNPADDARAAGPCLAGVEGFGEHGPRPGGLLELQVSRHPQPEQHLGRCHGRSHRLHCVAEVRSVDRRCHLLWHHRLLLHDGRLGGLHCRITRAVEHRVDEPALVRRGLGLGEVAGRAGLFHDPIEHALQRRLGQSVRTDAPGELEERGEVPEDARVLELRDEAPLRGAGRGHAGVLGAEGASEARGGPGGGQPEQGAGRNEAPDLAARAASGLRPLLEEQLVLVGVDRRRHGDDSLRRGWGRGRAGRRAGGAA